MTDYRSYDPASRYVVNDRNTCESIGDTHLEYSFKNALRMAKAYSSPAMRSMRIVWQERAADYRETLVDRMRRRQGWSLAEIVAGKRAEPIHGRHANQTENHKVIGHFEILDHGRYLGLLTCVDTYAGQRWSHSIQNHGTPLFRTSVEATHDFWDTKLRLPAEVHRVIFGA